MAMSCWRLPKFQWHYVARFGLATLAAATFWMAAVDYLTYRKGCIHCASHAIHGDYRVFHQPVWSLQDEDHFPDFRMIAEDLGAPCPHEFERFERMRLWGLLIHGPGSYGICCLDGGDRYRDSLRDRARRMGATDPKLAAAFRDEVCLQHNWVYARKFIGDLLAADAKDKSE
jgi:hypothetical protein